jgi:transcriptional regulator with XRE-family HTH domain
MEGIGERLKRRREELGLSREAAAEATKFQPDLIEAVEEGRAGVFSAKVYHLAFIRAYARVLQLDADQLIRDQKSEEERAQEALKGIKMLPSRSTRAPRGLIVAAAVVVAAVVVFLLVDRTLQGRKLKAPDVSGVKERASAGRPAGAGVGARGPKLVPVEKFAGDTLTGGAGLTDQAPQGQGTAASEAGGGADTSKAAGSQAAPPGAWPRVSELPPRGAKLGPRTLQLSAQYGALLTLASGGDTLFDGAVNEGDTLAFTSGKPFVLLFLNDRLAVSLTLDGKPVLLPSSNKREIFDYVLPWAGQGR